MEPKKNFIDDLSEYIKESSKISPQSGRCTLCGMPANKTGVCENCQLSIFQMNELKIQLEDALRNNKPLPEWAIKAAEKITEILADYPEFLVYKNIVSELIWTYIIDDDAVINGVPIEEVVMLNYTHKSRDEVIRELRDMKIIDVSISRRLFPGKLLNALLDLKKIYGDNFDTPKWKQYVSAIQSIFILNIVERMLKDFYKEVGRRPAQVLLIFKILSRVIQHYMVLSSEELSNTDKFSISELDIKAVMSILRSNKSRLRFYVNITGVKDGNSKLIEDFDENNKEFIINKAFNDYIKIMIERIREIERCRER